MNLAIRTLKRQRGRTALTVLGITVGVLAFVMLSAIAGGLESGFQQTIEKTGAELTVMQKNVANPAISFIRMDTVQEISQWSEVEYATPVIFTGITMEKVSYFVIYGVVPDEFLRDFSMKSGKALLNSDERGIMIGANLANSTKMKPGDTLLIGNLTFTVTGVYETGNAYLDGMSVARIQDIQKAFNMGDTCNVIFIKLKTNALDKADELEKRIESAYPTLEVTKSGELASKMENIQTLQSAVSTIVFVAALIAALMILNTMNMSVYERTKEIGILRAIGWGKNHIFQLIMSEALIISVIGGILGCLLGILMAFALEGSGQMPFLRISVTPVLVVEAVVFAAVVGILSGLLPALRAMRMKPIDTLRFE
ncbi:MAG: ABC transporter permease [Theionarchaea archaeon]|nr:ABC transporter permease [Theionarchaea archaeon]